MNCLSLSNTEVPILQAARSRAWSVSQWLGGGRLSSPSCCLVPSPECVGRSKPCSRTLIMSTALSDNLNVVLSVWSGHQNQINDLRGRIGKWVYLWSEGFEGLVTLLSYALPLWRKALQRRVMMAQHGGKTSIEPQKASGRLCWKF